MNERIPLQRIVPVRITQTKFNRNSYSQTFQQKQKNRFEELKELNEKKLKIENATKNFANSFNNIKQLQIESEKYYNNNVSNIDFRLRNFFKESLKQNINSKINEQNKNISIIENQIKDWKKIVNTTTKANTDANYRARINEANSFLNEMRSGVIYNPVSVLNFSKNVGSVAGSSVSKQLKNIEMSKLIQQKAILQRNKEAKQELQELKIPTIQELALEKKYGEQSKIEPKINVLSSGLGFESQTSQKSIMFKPSSTDLEKQVQIETEKREIQKSSAIKKLELDFEIQQLNKFSNVYNDLFTKKTESKDIFIDYVSGLTPKKKEELKKEFKSLPLNIQKKIQNYSSIKKSVNFLKSNIDIIKTGSITDKDFGFSLADINTGKPINLEKISNSDLKNISELRKLSDDKIKNIILYGSNEELNKLNLLLNSFNKFISKYQLLEKYKKTYSEDRIKELIYRNEKELDKLKPTGLESVFNSAKLINYGFASIKYNANLINLKNKLEKGINITKTDYNNYISSLYGLTSWKGIKNRLQKGFSLTTEDKTKLNFFINRSLLVANFLKLTAQETINYTIQNLSFIWKLGKGTLKNVASLIKSTSLDVYDYLKNNYSKLPTEQKNKIFERVKKEWIIINSKKLINNSTEAIKWIIKNPKLFMTTAIIIYSETGTKISNFIDKNPEKAVALALEFFITKKVIGKLTEITGLGIKYAKINQYLKKMPSNNERIVTKQIFDAGNKIKILKNVKIQDFDLNVLSKNKQLISTLSKILKKTKSVIYGSLVEYEAKLTILQKFYSKLLKKKLTKKQAVEIYIKRLQKFGLSKNNILDDILMKPKDIDIILKPRIFKSDIIKFQQKYRYIPEALKELFPKFTKQFGKKFTDFGVKELKLDKKSVFSQLTTKQIDGLLKSLVTSGESESAIFKIMFLQDLYDSGAKASFLQKFDVVGKFAIKGTDFAIDMHKSTDIAFTKQFLFFIFKQPLPFEKPTKVNFATKLIEYEKVLRQSQLSKQKELNKLINQYKGLFNKLGIKINYSKFNRNIEKLLEKTELIDKVQFDFLKKTARNKPINKQILKTYYEALNLSELGLSGIDSIKNIAQVENLKTFLRFFLKLSNKSGKIINKYNSIISEIEAKKQVLLYFSKGSKSLLKKILSNKFIDLDLKKSLSSGKPLTESEQKRLSEIISVFDKKLQNYYKDIKSFEKKSFDDLIKTGKEITVLKPEKKFINLGESVERDLDFIKGFKTGKILKTKSGIYYISPEEQLKRRIAGAVSTIFEDRRAKDIKKLYGISKFQESLIRIELEKPKPNISKLKDLIKGLKLNADQLRKTSSKFLTKKFRLEKLLSTKGVSETTGLNNIDFLAKNNIKDKGKYLAIITNEANKQISKTGSISKEVYLRWTKSLLNIAKKRNNPLVFSLALSLGTKGSKLRNFLINKLSFSVSSSSNKEISKSISLLPSISKSLSISSFNSISSSLSKSQSQSLSKSISKSLSLSNSESLSLSKSLSASSSSSSSQSLSKSISKSQSISRSISSSLSKYGSTGIILPIFSWKKKLKNKNINYMVNGLIKVGNKIKEIKLKTTPYRAFKYMINLVDNTTSRSFALKIVGLINKKDIIKPSLNKFRLKYGKNPLVLQFVEKSKYAIDTFGEKRGLKVSKYLKKNKKN